MSRTYIKKPKKNIVERTLMVKIVVNEKTIKDKYPNFESNFDNVEEFMDMIENDLDAYPNILGMADNPMYEWGYDVVVASVPFKLFKKKSK
jgi:hypothetical protein